MEARKGIDLVPKYQLLEKFCERLHKAGNGGEMMAPIKIIIGHILAVSVARPDC